MSKPGRRKTRPSSPRHCAFGKAISAKDGEESLRGEPLKLPLPQRAFMTGHPSSALEGISPSKTNAPARICLAGAFYFFRRKYPPPLYQGAGEGLRVPAATGTKRPYPLHDAESCGHRQQEWGAPPKNIISAVKKAADRPFHHPGPAKAMGIQHPHHLRAQAVRRRRKSPSPDKAARSASVAARRASKAGSGCMP